MKALVLLAFALSGPALADSQFCLGVKPDKRRLECFDREVAAEKNSQAIAIRLAKEKEIAAIKSLRRLASATRIGISLNEFNKIAVESILAVDEALPSITRGVAREAIEQSRQSFIDARNMWNLLVESDFITLFFEQGKPLLVKYQIDQKNILKELAANPFAKSNYLDRSKFVDPIIDAAIRYIEEAEKASAVP